MDNLSNQLNYDETVLLLEKEIELEGLAFFRVYGHLALKRVFFFSILRCQSYLNVSFKIKGMREDINIRWGNGVKYAYPIVAIFFSVLKNELYRHPFLRRTKQRRRQTPIAYHPTNARPVLDRQIYRNNNVWTSMMSGGYLAGKPAILLSSLINFSAPKEYKSLKN